MSIALTTEFGIPRGQCHLGILFGTVVAMFRLIILLVMASNVCQADFLSSLAGLANQGSASLMSTFMQLSSTLSSKKSEATAVEVNNVAAKLSSGGYLNGYDNSTFDSGYVTLGTLNTSALNTTLNGALSPSLLSTVAKLLNSSGIVSAVTITSDGYNLGTLTISTSTTKSTTPSGSKVTELTKATTRKTITITTYPLDFVSPLVSVNLTENATFAEKLQTYKNWYTDTIIALRKTNTNPNITDYRKAFFCYPGPAVLNESLESAPDWIRKAYQEIMDNATALNSTEILTNSTEVANLKSQIDNIASKLSNLAALISGSSSQDTVESQRNELQAFQSLLKGNRTLDFDLLKGNTTAAFFAKFNQTTCVSFILTEKNKTPKKVINFPSAALDALGGDAGTVKNKKDKKSSSYRSDEIGRTILLETAAFWGLFSRDVLAGHCFMCRRPQAHWFGL
uniref:DUF148 domain-containing protein n=1 Tax=Panagrellus redivivus TaxID=6233 RepID=A0A7E4UZZ8_PANRE